MQYEVLLKGEPAGIAAVCRQGLYYRVQCQCYLPDEQIYCLKVRCRERVTDLGICVPEKNGFTVCTSVSVKRVGEGELSFAVEPRYAHRQEQFYEVRMEKPFAYIDKLPQARLRTAENAVGVTFTQQE